MTAPDDKLEQAKEIIRTIDMLHNRVVGSLNEDPSILALTPRQFTLLLAVRNRDGVSIKEIADSLGVTTSSVSTMVERMVEARILTREPNPTDRRGVVVRVSPDVKRVIDPLERQALKILVDLLEKLGPEWARMWREIHARIRAILEEKCAPSAAAGAFERPPEAAAVRRM